MEIANELATVLRIIVLCVISAVVYGIVHDQVTARNTSVMPDARHNAETMVCREFPVTPSVVSTAKPTFGMDYTQGNAV